jgi:serine/threonine-protein kinase PpkA
MIIAADAQRFGRAGALTVLLGLVICLCLQASPPQAQAPDRPLLVEDRSTVYQRILTRPGAALHAEPGGAVLRDYPPFQPFYVFQRQDGWLRVGPSPFAPPSGWTEARATVDWRQNIVAAFTNSAGRNRQVIFDTQDSLQTLLNHEALLDMQAELLRQADSGQMGDERGVVSVEPAEYVNIRDELYIMPILDFTEDYHPLTYEPQLLMKIASVPLREEEPAPPTEVAAEFDAGVVFVFDTTLSMDPFIERTRIAVDRIVRDLRGTEVGDLINFGIVAFRDNADAVPGLDYRTRVLLPLERRTDQTVVLEVIQEATQVTTVSSPGFNEDSLAGVEDAIDLMDWEPDGETPFQGRYILLVTDAGPKDPRDPNARSDIGPAELQREAQDRGIVIMTLHLKSPSGGLAQHEYAEANYRQLSRFGDNTYYYPIEGGSPDAFEARVSTVVTALTDIIRLARGEAPTLSPEEVGQEIIDLGRAMQLAWLGRQRGTVVPDVIEGWISERAAENPRALAVEPRLLVTKNEMATMADLLRETLTLAEAVRGSDDADAFFTQVREIVARMAQDPDRLVNPAAESLGDALEFLEDLPYQSQIMAMTPERWGQSAMQRRQIMDGMHQKLVQYTKWLQDPTVWTSLYDGSPDGEYVFAMPFDVLP